MNPSSLLLILKKSSTNHWAKKNYFGRERQLYDEAKISINVLADGFPPPLFSFYLLSAKIIPNPRRSSRSQQSLSAVVIKVSCHPPDLIFLVGIPSTSEDAGNPFHLAETSPAQAGAWKGCSLNSRFFRPVVSIPHAFPGAKRSSSARLLSHLTGRM